MSHLREALKADAYGRIRRASGEVLMELGVDFNKKKQYIYAIEVFDEALRRLPLRSVPTYIINTRAWVLYNLRQYNKALSEFKFVETHVRKSKSPHPDLVYWMNLGLGWTYYMCEDFGRATHYFEKTRRFRPTRHSALLGLGWVAYFQAHLTKARPLFEQARRMHSAASTIFPLAWVAFYERDYAEAEKLFRESLVAAKESTESEDAVAVKSSIMGLALIAYHYKNYDVALKYLNNVEKACPSEVVPTGRHNVPATVYAIRGQIKIIRDGDAVGAIRDISFALTTRFYPNNGLRLPVRKANAYTYRALARAKLGQWKEADGDLRRAIEAKKDHDLAHEMLLLDMLRLQRFPDVISHATRMIDAPAYKGRVAQLARSLARLCLGDVEQGVEDLKATPAKDEDAIHTSQLHFLVTGHVLFLQGNASDTEKLYAILQGEKSMPLLNPYLQGVMAYLKSLHAHLPPATPADLGARHGEVRPAVAVPSSPVHPMPSMAFYNSVAPGGGAGGGGSGGGGTADAAHAHRPS